MTAALYQNVSLDVRITYQLGVLSTYVPHIRHPGPAKVKM